MEDFEAAEVGPIVWPLPAVGVGGLVVAEVNVEAYGWISMRSQENSERRRD